MNTTPRIPAPVNEPVLSYAPGTRERAELKQTLKDMGGRQIEIPVVVGGKEIRTGRTADAVMPHCHRHVLAKVHQAGPDEVAGAIAAARAAWRDWTRIPVTPAARARIASTAKRTGTRCRRANLAIR